MLEKALRYGKDVIGSIHGWDRMRFRGTLRWLCGVSGLSSYLRTRNILLKDFKAFAQEVTAKVRASCAEQAEQLDIPLYYLRSGAIDKEAMARQVARERKVETGDICMFSVVEPCYAPTVCGNREKKQLEVQMRPRRCIFIYHYWNHPRLGFGHSRLQSWLPLDVTVCLNGRHWLERQMLEAGIGYLKAGNCFPFISDLGRAQELLDQQLRSAWPVLLQELLQRSCPGLEAVLQQRSLHYYWSADQTEWASDIVFRSTEALDRVYPRLLRYGMVSAQSPEVMRFLGYRVIDGRMRGRVPKQVTSDQRKRYEGVRVKHRVNFNSIKMYNKAGNLLRIETTINNTRDFKVFRQPNDDPRKEPSWQKMRKGVSDLHRRAQVSQACNRRYAEHLSKATVTQTLQQTVAGACRPVVLKNYRRHRALNPWAEEDFKMLQFLALGEHAISGFRNKDLRAFLYSDLAPQERNERAKLSARITRRLALLRAHGLIKKVRGSSRYLLTARGAQFASAVMASSSADTQQLMDAAA